MTRIDEDNEVLFGLPEGPIDELLTLLGGVSEMQEFPESDQTVDHVPVSHQHHVDEVVAPSIEAAVKTSSKPQRLSRGEGRPRRYVPRAKPSPPPPAPTSPPRAHSPSSSHSDNNAEPSADGCEPNVEGLSARKRKNRESAFISRERKRAYTEELEGEVAAARAENGALRERQAVLATENSLLREQLAFFQNLLRPLASSLPSLLLGDAAASAPTPEFPAHFYGKAAGSGGGGAASVASSARAHATGILLAVVLGFAFISGGGRGAAAAAAAPRGGGGILVETFGSIVGDLDAEPALGDGALGLAAGRSAPLVPLLLLLAASAIVVTVATAAAAAARKAPRPWAHAGKRLL